MKHQTPREPCRRYDFGNPEIPSLADVADTVRADPTLAKRRAQLLTSLGHLPIYLGLTPPGRRRNRATTDRGIAQTIEFNVTRMRKALSLADPVQHEVSKKTILNDRSNINFLLDHLGLGGMRRHLAPFTEELQQFFDALGDRYLQTNLSRLLHFIAAHQLRLENVDADIVAGNPVDSEQLTREINALVRVLNTIGLKRRARQIPSPAEHLKSRDLAKL